MTRPAAIRLLLGQCPVHPGAANHTARRMAGTGVGFSPGLMRGWWSLSELAPAGRLQTAASSRDRGIESDAARRAPACALVIFGASGDLTERKLLPAIQQLAGHRRLRPEFALVGVARPGSGY
jgi:hypothetical protein